MSGRGRGTSVKNEVLPKSSVGNGLPVCEVCVCVCVCVCVGVGVCVCVCEGWEVQ